MKHHAWSLDPAGQAVLRRAEDGRTDAVPTLDELFAAVPWAAVGPTEGLRTERVTLEVTFTRGVAHASPTEWNWLQIVHDGHGLRDIDWVEVVA